MTRIAIISDIHGNLPALRAVLQDIEQQRIDRIYCLGDIIGKGPSPAEALELCRRHCDKVILGNWEDFLLYSDIDRNPIAYYRDRLSEEQRDYLYSLPYHIEFYLSGRLVRAFHAHPENVYRRVFSSSEPTLLAEMFLPPSKAHGCRNEFADLVIYGDIHYSFELFFDEAYYKKQHEHYCRIRTISYDEYLKGYRDAVRISKNRRLINVGSVGQPFDGTLATYVILEGVYGSMEKAPLSVEFVKLPYDNQEAARLALASDMEDKYDYSREILTGIFRGLNK